MNGRCDNDPLDAADNVCDLCGGDFCNGCLITPKGRKKPWCKKCALDRSGVRGGVKTQKKSSKRDARQRRKELTDSRDERDENRFVFFDDPESDFDVQDFGEEETEDEGSRRRLVSFGIRKNKGDESESTDQDDDTVSTIEESAYVASDAPAPPKAEDSTLAGQAPNGSDAPPPGPADAIAPEPTSTELLARLQDHLPDSVEDTAPAGPSPSTITSSSMPSLTDRFDPTFDPFAIPADPMGPTDDTEATDVAEPGSFDSFDSPNSFESFDSEEQFDASTPTFEAAPSEFDGHGPDFDFDASPPPPGPSEPAQTDYQAPATTERPSLLDRLGSDPGSAVSRVVPISEADFYEETEASESFDPGELITDDPMSEAEVFEPIDNEEPAVGGKGEDTDEDGNWIPPALRGMAPVEVRESLSLPKRGRS